MKHFLGNITDLRLRFIKTRLVLGTALLIAFGLFFSSCPNPVESGPSANQGETGSFSLTIDTVGAGKTIMPAQIEQTEFDNYYYKLVFTDVTSGGLDPVTAERTKDDISSPVELLIGTWDLVVTAYKDASRTQPVMEGCIEGIGIAVDSPVNRSVTLKAISGAGEGIFAWNISLAEGVETAVMEIIKADGTPLREINLLGTVSPNTSNASLSLPSGYYRLTFTISKSGTQNVEWKEILHVYQNMESFFTFNFTDEYLNRNIHNITYVYNNGRLDDVVSSLHGETITKPVDPERQGYTFDGWYREEALTTLWDFANDTVTEDITLYAKWSSSITPNLEEIRAKLDAGSGTITTPIPLEISGHLGDLSNESSVWRKLLAVLAGAGDYVTLDISGCAIEGEVFNNADPVSGMDRIVDISLPSSVTSIGGFAFKGSTNLKSVSLPQGITSIDGGAFSYCTSLTGITLPESLTFIGVGAFSNCTSLTGITLPESLTSIGDSAFTNCTSLINVILPSRLASINGSAFSGCTNLALTSLPSSVTFIGEYAFLNCSSLALTSLPQGITSIGLGAFYGCAKLALTSLPSGITSIGETAFTDCTKLALTSLPLGVTSIGGYAFSNCTSIVNITLPSSVASIGEYAFQNCVNLTEVTCLRVTPPSLGDKAFYNIYYDEQLNLQIKVPAGSVDVYKAAEGWSVYADEDRISWITAALTTIEDITSYLASQSGGATADNPVSLPVDIDLGIMIAAGSGWQTLLSAIGNADKYVSLDLSACTMTGTEFNPYGSITTGRNKIVEIALPNTAASIKAGTSTNESAFKYFSVLKSFSGEGLTAIGNVAFIGLTGLTMTSLPSGITSIGSMAFSGCTNLALTSLPNGLVSIDNSAFSGTGLTLTELPDSITTIASHSAFSNCTGLTELKLPANLTAITAQTFYNCRNLNRVTLPANLESIGSDAFHITGLTEITLPATVTSIGQSAFSSCEQLTLFTCEAVTPPTLTSGIFASVPTTMQIKVPAASVAAYKTAWSVCGPSIVNRISGIGTYSGTFTITYGQITNPVPDITGPTLKRSGTATERTVEISFDSSAFDAGSITWEMDGIPIGTEDSLTLSVDKSNPAYNVQYDLAGMYPLTLTVKKGGVPYNKTVTFTVVNN